MTSKITRLLCGVTRRQLIGAIASSAVLASTARAQSSDVITIVVPTSPGSGPDVLARMLGQRLSTVLNTTVVVSNRSGANGVVGATVVANAAPDGKTLLLYDRLTMSINPLLYARLPYDPAALVGVSDVATVDLLFAVKADAPYKTWAELVDYSRANPGRMSVGTAGAGSVHHLSLELIKRHYGLKITDIPYKGIAPAVTALRGGEIDGVITGQETVLEHIKAGKLRALAFGGTHRSRLLPGVPTLEELGAPDNLLISTSFTLFAPAKVPPEVVNGLQAAVAKVMQDKALVETLSARGIVARTSTATAVQSALVRDRNRFSAMIKESNIRLN